MPVLIFLFRATSSLIGFVWIDYIFNFVPKLFKRFVTPLEGTLNSGLLSKDVELKVLLVGVLILFFHA